MVVVMPQGGAAVESMMTGVGLISTALLLILIVVAGVRPKHLAEGVA